MGLRPSHARYYLNEMQELRKLLKNLQDKSISANRFREKNSVYVYTHTHTQRESARQVYLRQQVFACMYTHTHTHTHVYPEGFRV